MPVKRNIPASAASKNATTIEEAIAFLHKASAYQLEKVQTLMDAVTLAAEQVQDKRLELLELGPEIAASDVLIDFMFTFVLESPLVGKLLNQAVTKMLRPRVQSHLFAKEKALLQAKADYRRPLLPDVPLPGLASEGEILRSLTREIKPLRRAASILAVIPSDSGDFVVAFAKAVREAEKSPRNDTSPISTTKDSPGVFILNLAQNYVSAQRLSIQIEQAMMELWLRKRVITPEQVFRRLKWEPLDGSDKGLNLEQTKDYLKVHFELIIWSLLLYERSFTGKPVTTPRQTFTLKGYVQPSLIEYWLRRFLNPKTGRPFVEISALRSGGTRLPIERATGTLGNYMWEVVSLAKKNRVSLIATGPLQPKTLLLKPSS